MSEPMVIEFIGRVVEGNDGLEAVFDIEGGIAALEAGCSLYASVDLENAGLTDDEGSCELYRHADDTAQLREELDTMTAGAKALRDEWRKDQQEIITLRTQLDRLKKRAWAVMQEALDSASVHPCDEHSEEVKAKTLAPVYQDLYASLCAPAPVVGIDLGEPVVGIDLGEPGGDMSVTAVFHQTAGRFHLRSMTHSEPTCPFCFQVGCNGECHGDDMMGGG